MKGMGEGGSMKNRNVLVLPMPKVLAQTRWSQEELPLPQVTTTPCSPGVLHQEDPISAWGDGHALTPRWLFRSPVVRFSFSDPICLRWLTQTLEESPPKKKKEPITEPIMVPMVTPPAPLGGGYLNAFFATPLGLLRLFPQPNDRDPEPMLRVASDASLGGTFPHQVAGVLQF